MKRPRPYIPLSVRVQVAERQLQASGAILCPLYFSVVEQNANLDTPLTLTHRLRLILGHLFPEGDAQLDHDPALILRRFNKRTGKYTPAANSPDHLVYRAKADHLQKTTGRKPGASRTITSKGSDIGLKTKFAKLERVHKSPRGIPRRGKPKQKIASRPFQKRRRKLR